MEERCAGSTVLLSAAARPEMLWRSWHTSKRVSMECREACLVRLGGVKSDDELLEGVLRAFFFFFSFFCCCFDAA
eukprot:2284299-Pleurochrysis_carterae.AAC.1